MSQVLKHKDGYESAGCGDRNVTVTHLEAGLAHFGPTVEMHHVNW